MEIERKFLVRELPEHMEQYDKKVIEQGYLCRKPTVRIRKSNEEYILTYKSDLGVPEMEGRVAKVLNEIEMPLTKDGYEHLKEKVDYYIVAKDRYLISLKEGLTAELDIFKGRLDGLIVVEVEFPDEETASRFQPPEWFGQDVSLDGSYTNGKLSTLSSW